jgi:hypothetical protein
MKKEPTAYCCHCSEPIFSNVTPNRDVVCWKCVQRLLGSKVVKDSESIPEDEKISRRKKWTRRKKK